MKKPFIILTGWLALSAAACRANLVHKPAPSYDISSTQIVDTPYDEVWSRAVSWFAGRNITIDKIEKPSGLITAKYRLVMTDRELDAGEFLSNDKPMKVNVLRDATLNVLLRSLEGNRTEVTCNVFGSFEAWSVPSKGSLKSPQLLWTGTCQSTGMLEKSFFDQVGRDR